MTGDDDQALRSNPGSNNSKENPPQRQRDDKKKKKKKSKNNKMRGGTKRKMATEQSVAFKSVSEWVFLDSPDPSPSSAASFLVDDFGIQKSGGRGGEKVVFELHSHSKFSDGFLSPSKLIERAHANGVKVLALTDHDTMSGIPEALEASQRYKIKIIPGVEISTIFTSRSENEWEEPVHILAYYSSCGPARYEELEKLLSNIRDGRFHRAQNMVAKLNKLKLPLKWESVLRIAGKDVAPGRLHVARAMVEAGYVENLKQAFARYLFDGGPAYATGSEPPAEEAVQLIRDTGGVAVLAHPWALKNPVPIISRLTEAGLHGVEVHRSDGKLSVYSDLADAHGLLNLGGSDFHGKGGNSESELGSVNLPVMALHDFLKVARPIWCKAIRANLQTYIDEPSDSNLSRITRFGRIKALKEDSINPVTVSGGDFINRCLSSWLSVDERQEAEFEALRSRFSDISVK